ncbi:MAG: ATP synthase F1 subunit gamma [Clostridiales bacterium]|nr:ATP synthase F1 subunit gamma [Clostridiales bacterium]
MAGVSTKEIKNRIRSMESTKQITKAMEMVAASKLRRAQAQVDSARPYFKILLSVIHDIIKTNTDFDSPYLNAPKTGKTLFVVIAGDRGLAGGYNSNVLKMVMAEMAKSDSVVLPIGKKALDFFRARKADIVSDAYPVAEAVQVGDCFTIAKNIAKAFKSGEYCSVSVAYTNFVSVLSQTPDMKALLPLQYEDDGEEAKKSEILYEGGSVEVFDAIVPEYMGGVLYGALCESRAAEQAARRTAMDSATSNAEDMIADLSLKFNRARQAAITQEITEIVAGA